MIDKQHFSDSHETSMEVVDAIAYLAQNNPEEMERIWEEPTREEEIAIWERATKNGLIDDNELFWGESTLNQVING